MHIELRLEVRISGYEIKIVITKSLMKNIVDIKKVEEQTGKSLEEVKVHKNLNSSKNKAQEAKKTYKNTPGTVE